MSASVETDLSWAARPGRALARLALPITVSTLSYAAMNLVSTMFVAHLGADALAGVGLGAVISFALVCFGIGMLRGAKTLVAQALGAGRPELVNTYLGAAIALGITIGLVAAVTALVLAPHIGGLCASPQAGAIAGQYLAWRTLSAPIVLVFVALREVAYGQGDAVRPMRASIAGNVTNIGLDAILIVGLGYGVRGAAIATIGGQLIELLVVAWPARARLRTLRLRVAAARAVWRQGLPTGLQFLIEVGSFVSLTAIVARMSSTDAGAHQLVIHLVNVSFLPAHALAEATSVLVGQAVGADRDDLVPRVGVRALQIGIGYALVCMIVFAVFGQAVVTALAGDPAMAHAATTLLYISIAFLIADSANVIARGVLRGAGDVRYAAVLGVVTAWLATPPLAYLLGITAGWGAAGGWVGLAAEIIVGALLFWRRVWRGGWHSTAARCRAELQATRG